MSHEQRRTGQSSQAMGHSDQWHGIRQQGSLYLAEETVETEYLQQRNTQESRDR